MEPTAIDWWTLGAAVLAAVAAVVGGVVAWRNHRATFERHDVVWEGHWAKPGRYVLENVGDSTAREVVAMVSVNDETVRVTADHVDPGGELVFEFPGAAKELQRLRAKQGVGGLHAIDAIMGESTNPIRERVWWQSRRRVPHRHVEDFPNSSLD